VPQNELSEAEVVRAAVRWRVAFARYLYELKEMQGLTGRKLVEPKKVKQRGDALTVAVNELAAAVDNYVDDYSAYYAARGEKLDG
jgi:hypothetical protein